MPKECSALAVKINRKDFLAWAGLAESCSASAFFKSLQTTPAPEVAVQLGSARQMAALHAVPLDGYSYPLQAWTVGDQLVRLAAEFPDVALKPTAIQTALGEPDARLDYEWSGVTFRSSEWVYARIGLSVFLDGDGARAIRIWAYRPMNMEEYLSQMRTASKMREF